MSHGDHSTDGIVALATCMADHETLHTVTDAIDNNSDINYYLY